ncbi:TPA: GNAT family N-acetyltransferase [Aeromonas veronii]|nr:GNAT family N-acetyltransferase [Aeromonas veronii]
MVITLREINLRTFKADDLAFVYAGLSDPDVIQFYGISYSTEAACEEQMRWYQSIEEQGVGCWFLIESAEGKLGALGLNNICREHHNAELGYWLLPHYWGRGIMRKALCGLLSYAFNELKLHRIGADVEMENLRSQQLLRTYGFVLEGVSRECEIKSGQYVSLMKYSLLKHEFKDITY